MLLVVDVGNTQTVIGVYEGDSLRKMWRIDTAFDKDVGTVCSMLGDLFLTEGMSLSDVSDAVLATVVPSQRELWDQVCVSAFGVEVFAVDAGAVEGLIGVEARGAGADRLANAVAGAKIYGSPVIIVDFGTATDMEVVSQDGVFLGGAIAPGVQTALRSLVKGTSLLPATELSRPKFPIGADTIEAIKSGVVLGEADRIDGLVRRMWSQLGYRTPVVATGGFSEVIGSLCETVTAVNPELTLQGLRIIFEHDRDRIIS